MSEDCRFAHTDDNRFTNTNTNRWFGIKDDSERDFSSKGMAIGAARREIGGAGLGFGKRPYLHTDYAEMMKSTTDKEAFDRMAAGGYFPGRAMLERPYGSRNYQEMKYQKPVAPLLGETPPDLVLERPEFEIPEIPGVPTFPDRGRPMWVHGYICITDVSRLKVCAENDNTAEGVEIYDITTGRFTKEALIASDGTFSIYIFNIVQIRQIDPYVWFFIHDGSDWRVPTGAESARFNALQRAIPGRELVARTYCGGWNSWFDNTYWEIYAAGYGSWETTFWQSDWYASGGGYNRLNLDDIGTWVQGIKPTHARLTFTGVSHLDYSLITDNNEYLCSDTCWPSGNGVASGDSLVLNWTGKTGEINRWVLNDATISFCSGTQHEFYVTNIEFYIA